MRVVTYAEQRLVKRHRGTMPLILTAAHGGSAAPPQVQERDENQTPPGCDFVTSRDNETALITELLAQKILELSGLTPYVVMAQFHRKYIDANRSEECAFTDLDAQPHYREYHDILAGYIGQLLSQNQGRGFLFDIHGTRVIQSDPADIYLGTAGGASLPAGFDRRNLFMQHGLHGLLKSARRTGVGGDGAISCYRLSPANEAAPETRAVSGGYTIRHYGAIINCIQIEIANTIREDPERRGYLVEDLAAALINFSRRYAPF